MIDTEAEFRAVQNYATWMVHIQPTGADFTQPGQMAAAVKLYPFPTWPEGAVGTPNGLRDASPVYYMQP